MNETARLIDDATRALVRLDADALGACETHALSLDALHIGHGQAVEAGARLRVFAGVLRETGRGLEILERVRGAGDRWAR